MPQQKKPNRRDFLGTSATAAAAAWTGANLYAKAAKANPGPNDTINMALIGCGARGGNQVMPSFMELPGVRITAVCDVNSNHLAKYRQKETVMTTKKGLKKRVRARQARTGESYSTARLHVLRGKHLEQVDQDIFPKRITAIALSCSEQTIRLRQLYGTDVISLRTGGFVAHRVAPGQFVDVELSKQWTWSGTVYCAIAAEHL